MKFRKPLFVLCPGDSVVGIELIASVDWDYNSQE